MNNDRENMSKSEMSLRKFLKNLGVTSHKIIEEKLNSSLKNGGFDYNQEITINADIKIKELDISHSVSAKIYTPERDE
tara:strand:+ start:185 stop:418 length:234 start_codon:yes stop_codon:yes gene_type:complete